MRNFKQFLQEEQLPQWQYKTKEDIEHYFDTSIGFTTVPKKDILINDDLSVIVNDDILISNYNLTKYNNQYFLPIQFKKTGQFYIAASNLNSLRGSPYICTSFSSHSTSNITSLEYAPIKVTQNTHLHYFDKVKSLTGIGRKFLKQLNEYLFLPISIESNILGCCLIEKINNINFIDRNTNTDKKLEPISNILNKHLQTDGDECMEELIQNGYKNYAKF